LEKPHTGEGLYQKDFFPFRKLNPNISNVIATAANMPTLVSLEIFM
jgi:hypothetical protein